MGRLYAQATGTIVGAVTDMSGAGVARVSVQVKNSGTGVSQSTTTDPAGRFHVPDLVIGTYEMEPGFQMVVHKGITLTVGSEPAVDFSLPAGQAQQMLTVEGQVWQVDTPSTSVGSPVRRNRLLTCH